MQWPYVAKSGRKSYRVGFRDHEAIVRSKAFPSAKLANEWVQQYIAAERRGAHSLQRFLLDLDAKDATGDSAGKTIGEVIQLYFAFNAPEIADGLSASTFRTYRHSASRHLLGMPGIDKGNRSRRLRTPCASPRSLPRSSTDLTPLVLFARR